MVRDEVRLKFISVSKQALGVGAVSGLAESPLARADRLEAFVARSPSRIDQAIELRLRMSEDAPPGLSDGWVPRERDEHDDYCQHLVVVDRLVDGVVGTCRLLTPMAAQRCGRYGIESVFDLAGLRPIRAQLLELGEVGIEADGRSGAILMLLWSAIGTFMTSGCFRYLIGTAGIPARGALGTVVALHDELVRAGLQSDTWLIEPRQGLPRLLPIAANAQRPQGLFKAYLKAGARLVGAPAFDPVFDRAEFPMLLDRDGVGSRVARRFPSAR